MTASLIVLVGEIGSQLHHIGELIRTGAVVVIAPSEAEARRWLRLPNPDQPLRRPHRKIVLAEDFTIDQTSHRAIWRGKELPLTERELQILGTLGEDPGRAWSFGELTERAWGSSYYGGSGPVCAAVQRLRHKLAGTTVFVESVRGVGFRLRVEGSRPPE